MDYLQFTLIALLFPVGIAIGLWIGWELWLRPPVKSRRAIEADVDRAMGLVLLPDIRVSTALAAQLKIDAHTRGLILQAHIRDLLTIGSSRG